MKGKWMYDKNIRVKRVCIPGESIRLIKNSVEVDAGGNSSLCGISKKREMEEALMVIPRSCSSSRVLMYLISPETFSAMIPAFWISESVNVVFPWSTLSLYQ